ncbi:hypothetical protein GCM10023259_075880 [Thermocatellispora tengchongensis]
MEVDVTWSRPLGMPGLPPCGREVHVALPTAAALGTIRSGVNQGALVDGGEATAVTRVRAGIDHLAPCRVSGDGLPPARRVRPAPVSPQGTPAPCRPHAA